MNSHFKHEVWSVAISAELAQKLALEDGGEVVLSWNGETFSLPVRRRLQLDLEKMLASVTDENCHPETDWGSPVGRERWWEDETNPPVEPIEPLANFQ